MSNINPLINEIRQNDAGLSLLDGSNNAFPSVSEEGLSYVLSILREKEQVVFHQRTDREWLELITYLNYHGITPLIYWNIIQLPVVLRPPKIFKSRMRDIFLRTNVHYQILTRQLREILDAFNKEKIDVLVLKGPALAWTIYPDFATRPIGDIDLLVKPEQFLQAREVLNRIGYQCQFKRFEKFRELSKAEQFIHSTDARKPLEVDLHWYLFHYYGIWRNNGVEVFFDRSETVITPALTFETLGKVDTLIYLAIHSFLNHPEGIRLLWIYDLALLAQKLSSPVEWETLLKRTSELKAHLAVEKALKLAQIWNGLRVPTEYSDFSKWSNSVDAEKAELIYAVNKQGPDIRMKGYLATVRSAPKKIPFLMKLVFPDPDFMLKAYPPSKRWLLPWSYVRRWGRWIVKVARYLLNR
jgi:hypothetical protein